MGERVYELRSDVPNKFIATRRLLMQIGIFDQSKVSWMTTVENLIRPRWKLSWLGGKRRFVRQSRPQGRDATD